MVLLVEHSSSRLPDTKQPHSAASRLVFFSFQNIVLLLLELTGRSFTCTIIPFIMARLATVLAVAQAVLVQGLPAHDVKREPAVFDERAITFPSSLPVTTTYTSTPSSLQSATQTVSASLTGVNNLPS